LFTETTPTGCAYGITPPGESQGNSGKILQQSAKKQKIWQTVSERAIFIKEGMGEKK